MCLAVYLASDKELPSIPWNEGTPGFHVDELNQTDLGVLQQFPWPNVSYVGSHTFCGCGFQAGEYRGSDHEPPDLAEREQSLQALSHYLAARLADGAQVRIFACWEGNEETEPEETRRLTAAEIGSPEFWFKELELIEIV